MKKIKGREIALLLVPLLLAGGAFVLQRNQRPTDGPFRLVFDRATVERITSPRDVADGYDTKLTVYLDYAGQVPDWWASEKMTLSVHMHGDALLYEKGGRTVSFKRANGGTGTRIGNHWDKEQQRYVCKFSMRLAEVPPSEGPVIYKTSIDGSFVAPYKGQGRSREELEYAPVPISIQVRQPGEVVKKPLASRYCPLRLQSVSVTPPPTSYGKEATEVIMYFQYRGSVPPGNSAHTVNLEAFDIFDEKGRKQKFRNSKGETYWGMTSIPTTKADQRNVVLNIPLTGIPKSAGRLTLKGSASIDNCWPLPVSVVVRK